VLAVQLAEERGGAREAVVQADTATELLQLLELRLSDTLPLTLKLRCTLRRSWRRLLPCKNMLDVELVVLWRRLLPLPALLSETHTSNLLLRLARSESGLPSRRLVQRSLRLLLPSLLLVINLLQLLLRHTLLSPPALLGKQGDALLQDRNLMVERLLGMRVNPVLEMCDVNTGILLRRELQLLILLPELGVVGGGGATDFAHALYLPEHLLQAALERCDGVRRRVLLLRLLQVFGGAAVVQVKLLRVHHLLLKTSRALRRRNHVVVVVANIAVVRATAHVCGTHAGTLSAQLLDSVSKTTALTMPADALLMPIAQRLLEETAGRPELRVSMGEVALRVITTPFLEELADPRFPEIWSLVNFIDAVRKGAFSTMVAGTL